MKTSKPISTISFNTEPFLKGKLRELQRNGTLEFWVYIRHDPEPDEVGDEAGGKDHFHVYMEPAKMVQTTEIREQFKEPDMIKGKPRGCLLVEKSNFDNWYLYALHDPDYLASKGQSRCYSYDPAQFVTGDEDDLHSKVTRIDVGSITPYIRMAQYQRDGKDFRSFVLGEQIPIRDISNYQKAWNMLSSTGTDRNGRPGHANEYTETEVMDLYKDDPDHLPGQMTIEETDYMP